MTIRTPPAWGLEELNHAVRSIGSSRPEEYWSHAQREGDVPAVRRLRFADLKESIAMGWEDFGAYRTDVVFLCVIYPLVGLILARLAFGYEMVPLLFPLASGFALVGPFAGVGLNEMSRRREEGMESRWYNTFAVIGSPAIGKILLLGAILVGIFLFWMIVAQLLYIVTLGPHPPVSISQFAHDVLHTSAGWTMIVVGIGLGFLFAVLVLAISVVSFPMLLDRNVPLDVAVRTSMRVATANPGIMAAWGVIIAAALVVGSIPVLLGLVIVMPVLGHATWHLYRHAVGP